MNSKINVLVTAVGGRSVGYQILECLKLSGENYKIITVDMDAFSPGLYESDISYLVPSASDPDYINSLIEIAKKEDIRIILPGSQPELLTIAKNKDLFIKENIVPLVTDYEIIDNCLNKIKLYELLSSKGITTPKTGFVKNPADIEDIEFPLIIKPAGVSSGSKNVFIVKDKKELELLTSTISDEFIIQEYVGDKNNEFTVGIIVEKSGNIVDSIVMKRYLTGFSLGQERTIDGKKYVLSTGYSQGFFVQDDTVKNYCEKVVKQLNLTGPVNIQCRKIGDKVFIFEIHPRFSGSASQRAAVGFNEPDYLIKHYLNLPVKKPSYKLDSAVIRKFANTLVKTEDYKKVKKLS